MKPIDVTDDSYAEYNEEFNKKDLESSSLKFVTILEFQNTKTFSLKNALQIGQKKFLLLVKLKIQSLGLMLLMT